MFSFSEASSQSPFQDFLLYPSPRRPGCRRRRRCARGGPPARRVGQECVCVCTRAFRLCQFSLLRLGPSFPFQTCYCTASQGLSAGKCCMGIRILKWPEGLRSRQRFWGKATWHEIFAGFPRIGNIFFINDSPKVFIKSLSLTISQLWYDD